MSFESALLGGVFNFDNFVKYKWCNELNYPSVTVDNDVCFSDSNPEVCKCDLLYAKNSKKYKKYPVLVNIHGGGWIIGDKKNSNGFCLQIADGGIFVMNINYGLPPKYKFPYQIQTHFEAFKWLEENADKYNLDLENVFVSGDSAGSHMSAVVAACHCSPEYGEALGIRPTSIKLKGALLFCGMYDLHIWNGMPMDKVPVARSMMQEFLGVKDVTTSPFYNLISPLEYINEKMPRTFLVSGAIDIMTKGEDKKMEEKFKKFDVDYVTYHGKNIPNSFHDFMLLAFTNEAKKCLKASLEFINDTVAMQTVKN
ncbi:MAG: alpha/beta hydrolase fold domain-containing protein [Oscillospiraceae bacterium]